MESDSDEPTIGQCEYTTHGTVAVNTKLPNLDWTWSHASQITRQRSAFISRTDLLLSESANSERIATLILVEISNLRQINQRHGYAAGDKMVDAMLERLPRSLKRANSISRIGGQTFAVLIIASTSPDVIAMTAAELKDAIDCALDLEATYLPPNIRVAATMAPTKQTSASRLLEAAEHNLRHSVAADGSDIELMISQEQHITDDQLERPFADALRDHRFCCHFQPQVAAVTGELCNVEALIRWHDSTHGWVRPERIIELADQSGKCLDLLKLVLDQSLAFAAAQKVNSTPIKTAVNLSPKVLQHPELLDCIDERVKRAGLRCGDVNLEVTEQALVTDIESGSPIMRALRDRGYGLSIDDFGRGYSSLAYLRDMPATELKIDRMFIARAHESERDRKLLCMIVDMAHLYDMTVIAEGIEQPEAQAVAIAAGCDLLQGWHIGKPMTEKSFEQWQSMWSGWDRTFASNLHQITWR